MSYLIRLEKEGFKFSCSHFTIFSKSEAERLHGHNYYVGVNLEVDKIQSDIGMAFDFNQVKPIIKSICDSMDEMVLVPEQSPYLKVLSSEDGVRVEFNHKKYLFPKEDVKMLPVVNISTEELARYVAVSLQKQFDFKKFGILKASVSIRETQGQSIEYTF